jgi:hypothetical protein
MTTKIADIRPLPEGWIAVHDDVEPLPVVAVGLADGSWLAMAWKGTALETLSELHPGKKFRIIPARELAVWLSEVHLDRQFESSLERHKRSENFARPAPGERWRPGRTCRFCDKPMGGPPDDPRCMACGRRDAETGG